MAAATKHPSWMTACTPLLSAAQGTAAASCGPRAFQFSVLPEAHGLGGSGVGLPCLPSTVGDMDGTNSLPPVAPARRARGPHMCEVSCVRELRPLPPTPSRSALPSAWRRVRLMRQMWLRASMNRTSFSLVVLIWL